MSMAPNIIWIMADDMGYGDVGCFNPDSKIPTPNMDRLAAEGMRFTDAHSVSSVCTPSRYGVLTGRYCWRTRLKSGVDGGFSQPLIDPARLTVAGLLKQQGYATAAVGKWHVGLDWQGKEDAPFDPNNWADEGHVDYTRPFTGGPNAVGFDTFFGIAGSLDMPPYCFLENDRTVGIPSVEKSPYNPQQKEGFMTPGWRDEDCDVRFAEQATAWIDARTREDGDRPFFLYMTPAAPHRPCMPPDFAKGKSDAGARGDMVWVVDWVVGQVAAKLDELGIADNTLIIVTSDNGAQRCDVDGEIHDHKSCGDWRGYKADIYDGGHREPFIARWPAAIAAGSTCDATICLADFMATCADLTGVELPDNAAEDSFSFLPALRGQADGSTRTALVHHSVDGMFGVRKGDWKLCMGLGSGGFSKPRREDPCPGGPRGQLYRMDTDPSESTNLWREHPEVVERLSGLLQQWVNSGRSR